MDHFSVKDQYCNEATGNWHETVFFGSEDCQGADDDRSFDLTFTTDGCVGGLTLKECSFHPCSSSSTNKEEEAGGAGKYEHATRIGRLLDEQQ